MVTLLVVVTVGLIITAWIGGSVKGGGSMRERGGHDHEHDLHRLANAVEDYVRDYKLSGGIKQELCELKEMVRCMDTKLNLILQTEADQMALGQEILDAVTAETTVLDSFIALIEGQIANNTIPAAVGAAILANVNSNKTKLEAAIIANTPQADPNTPPA